MANRPPIKSGRHKRGRTAGMKKRKSSQKLPALEHQYSEFFQYVVPSYSVLISGDESSLEQPSPLKVVPSVVTYGAYEEPLIGA